MFFERKCIITVFEKTKQWRTKPQLQQLTNIDWERNLNLFFAALQKKTSTLVFYQKYSPHFCIHVRIFGLQPKKSGLFINDVTRWLCTWKCVTEWIAWRHLMMRHKISSQKSIIAPHNIEATFYEEQVFLASWVATCHLRLRFFAMLSNLFLR